MNSIDGLENCFKDVTTVKGKKVGYTVRYIVRFDEEIDGEALRNAFESAMKRYPYLRLKLVKGLFSDHLEYNDALNTSEALTLGGEQANGHLLALSYKRRSIYVNNSHGIFDGRGRAPFMRILIYYYCLLRYDEPVEMENVNLAGGYFLLDISQMWKEDVYYDAFRRELEANGLHPETTYVYDQRCTLFEV